MLLHSDQPNSRPENRSSERRFVVLKNERGGSPCNYTYILPSLKLTWNLKIPPWKRRNILKAQILGFYISFRGCMFFWFWPSTWQELDFFFCSGWLLGCHHWLNGGGWGISGFDGRPNSELHGELVILRCWWKQLDGGVHAWGWFEGEVLIRLKIWELAHEIWRYFVDRCTRDGHADLRVIPSKHL